jgi:uncharacterized membrane protein
MIATVVWIGGLLFYAVLLTPVLAKIDAQRTRLALLETLQRRFAPLALLSLAVLLGTGLVQMSAHPRYEGLLSFGNRWSLALLFKHLAFGLMAALSVYQIVALQPKITRMLLRKTSQTQAEPPDEQGSLPRYLQLTRLNALLSLIVLALTAIARTA